MRNTDELLKYGFSKETEFMYGLTKLIDNEDIVMKKMEDQYANVDFIITNKNNDTTLYIELKSRTIDISKFNSFMIGRNKLFGISQKYKNDAVILVWIDTHHNLFYKLYNDDLLNSEIKYSNGSDVFLIKKEECKNSNIETLATCISEYHKQN